MLCILLIRALVALRLTEHGGSRRGRGDVCGKELLGAAPLSEGVENVTPFALLILQPFPKPTQAGHPALKLSQAHGYTHTL